MTMTFSAPSMRALAIASWPTGPAPHTAMTLRGVISHCSAPM